MECVGRAYKSTIGDERCQTCESGNNFNASTQQCTNPAFTQQVVKLYHGVNYVSFYVFDDNPNGTLITDIFRRNLNSQQTVWKTATLVSEGPSVLSTQTGSTDFAKSEIKHNRRNVYKINIEFFSTTDFVECTYSGNIVHTLEEITLQIGSQNYFPVLYDTVGQNNKVMPIQIDSLCTVPTSLTCFRYVEYDVFTLITRDANGNIVSSTTAITSSGIWNQQRNLQRGQLMRLTLRGNSNRPTGQTVMRAYITASDSESAARNRANSYGVFNAPAVSTRRLLSTDTPTLDAFCPTQTSTTSQCACVSAFNNRVLNWPVHDCNKCVLAQTQACDSMGSALTLAKISFTIGVLAPTGIQIDTNSIAVAKLKRSFEFSSLRPLPQKAGVQYEHLSIRANGASRCGGCVDANAQLADCASALCLNRPKIWVFEIGNGRHGQ